MGLKDWKEAKANKKIVKEENLINKANAQKIATPRYAVPARDILP